MQIELPESIETKEAATAYLDLLFTNDMFYHMDDDVFDIVWDKMERPSDAELTKMNSLQDQLFEIDGFDPHEYMMLKIKKQEFTETIANGTTFGL